jgi:hypothetical protein
VKAAASTSVAGAGNSETTENLPDTLEEIDISEATSGSIPLETVPSSASLSSPFPGDFTAAVDIGSTDWSTSYHGLSTQAFSKDIANILLAPVDDMDIEMKPGTFGAHGLRFMSLNFDYRWLDLPSRNKVSSCPQQGIWTRGMGACPSQ